MTNIWSDAWESTEEGDWSGGRGRSFRLPRGEKLGASVYELPPGGFVIRHFHHAAEELLLVLRGRPTLWTPEGERELEEGDVVHFPNGPLGDRRVENRSGAPVRILVAGNRDSPEVAEYPDLGQVTAQSRLPSQAGEELFLIHQLVERNP